MSDTHPKPDLRARVLLLGLLLLAVALRVAIASSDISTLTTRTLSDDSFYYFQIAKNAAAGNGVTFDGVEPTNGFHPLWFALLLPVYLVFGGSLTAPIHAALILEGLLDVGAGLLLYSLVRSLTKSRLGAFLAAGVYLLNPSVIFHSVNGLETGVNLFCFTLYFRHYLRMLDAEEFSAKNLLILGLLSGLLMLARTDNFIVVGVVYAHLLFVRKMMKRPAPVAASAALCAVVIMPWVLWNLFTFGSVLQSSGGAYSIVTRGNLRAAGVTDFQIFMTSLSNTVRLLVWTIPVDVFGWGKILGITAGLGAGMLLSDDDRTRRAWAAARMACVPLVSFLALALAHSLLRGTVKSWYFMPAAALCAMFLGIFCSPYELSAFTSRWRSRVVGAVLVVIVLSGYALNGWTGWKKGMYSWQTEQLMAAEWLRKHVDAETPVGSFNAGIVGYMSERNVINLDGLVNNSVAPYLRERRLWEYIRARGIEYLVDSDYSILKDYRDFYGPDWKPGENILRVATIDDPRVSWAGADVGVYRVLPSGLQ